MVLQGSRSSQGAPNHRSSILGRRRRLNRSCAYPPTSLGLASRIHISQISTATSARRWQYRDDAQATTARQCQRAQWNLQALRCKSGPRRRRTGMHGCAFLFIFTFEMPNIRDHQQSLPLMERRAGANHSEPECDYESTCTGGKQSFILFFHNAPRTSQTTVTEAHRVHTFASRKKASNKRTIHVRSQSSSHTQNHPERKPDPTC